METRKNRNGIGIGIGIIACIVMTFSCRSKPLSYFPKNIDRSEVSHNFLDTIIYIDSLDFLTSDKMDTIKIKEAELVITNYFSKIGYYNEQDSAKFNFERAVVLCTGLDTLHLLHLNPDKCIDAIVEYEDAPCFGSSRCFMPHKAIMTYIANKYRFIARDFIPSNYFIDSIRAEKGFKVIYGYDYDCGAHEVTRRFRAQLVRK
nr:hypothetical protein [uncultured Flavobacterium sp.]